MKILAGPELRLSWDKFPRPQLGPFSSFLLEAQATHHIPFHLNFFPLRPDIDVDRRFYGLKAGSFRQVRLLMLGFNSMVGRAAIDVVAVNADTHGLHPLLTLGILTSGNNSASQ